MSEVTYTSSNNPAIIEYVIVLYASGKVVTIIGFADTASAHDAFHKAIADNQADWAHLCDGKGQLLASHLPINPAPL